jgi:hypothetical protein
LSSSFDLNEEKRKSAKKSKKKNEKNLRQGKKK